MLLNSFAYLAHIHSVTMSANITNLSKMIVKIIST